MGLQDDMKDNPRSSELGSDERLKGVFERVSKDDEARVLVHNYSVQVMMGAETQGVSFAGLRLGAAGQQAASDGLTEKSKDKNSFAMLVLKLAMEANIEAMRRAIDEHIERLREEIAVLEVERDQRAAELEGLREELRAGTKELAALRTGVERVEAGGELELDEGGDRLRDRALEATMREYELRNGCAIDRSDSALLLAIMQLRQAELTSSHAALEDLIKERSEHLARAEQGIANRAESIREAVEFRSELEKVGALPEGAERDARFERLIEEAPAHLLNALRESGVSGELGSRIDALLEPDAAISAEDEAEADAFLKDVLARSPQAEPSSPAVSPPRRG